MAISDCCGCSCLYFGKLDVERLPFRIDRFYLEPRKHSVNYNPHAAYGYRLSLQRLPHVKDGNEHREPGFSGNRQAELSTVRFEEK